MLNDQSFLPLTSKTSSSITSQKSTLKTNGSATEFKIITGNYQNRHLKMMKDQIHNKKYEELILLNDLESYHHDVVVEDKENHEKCQFNWKFF
jgi:hypothetical protein